MAATRGVLIALMVLGYALLPTELVSRQTDSPAHQHVLDGYGISVTLTGGLLTDSYRPGQYCTIQLWVYADLTVTRYEGENGRKRFATEWLLAADGPPQNEGNFKEVVLAEKDENGDNETAFEIEEGETVTREIVARVGPLGDNFEEFAGSNVPITVYYGQDLVVNNFQIHHVDAFWTQVVEWEEIELPTKLCGDELR